MEGSGSGSGPGPGSGSGSAAVDMNDAAQLWNIIEQLNQKLEQQKQESEQKNDVIEQKNDVIEQQKREIQKLTMVVPAQQDTGRLIGIDFRVVEQSLKHSFDLKRFLGRVQELFGWWETKKDYMAPYFPLVQSSGMGKTKLLHEAHQSFVNDSPSSNETKDGSTHTKKKAKINDDDDDDDMPIIEKVSSAFILCRQKSHTPQNDMPNIYTEMLQVPQAASQGTRDQICEQLNQLLGKLQEQPTATTATSPTTERVVTKRKVVFFVDEAQHLLSNDAFGFRCVRWWLRTNRRDAKVAAVFAGTSSGLANFYRDDPVVSQSSRDTRTLYFESGSKLFEPFFDLCTMGVFVKRTPSTPQPAPADKNDTDASDYDRAIPYGRPLFALMKQDGKLTQDSEKVILQRMTLSESDDWFKNDQACLSVLGTRVQMGQTSLSIASELVKKGYANLTYFCGPAQIAQIAYMPDPVCARLAMCIMDPAWNNFDKFQGQEKKNWSEKMSQIISTGLCRPHKGDLGEVASALYLLFCGDMIRATYNGDAYHTFQVPVLKFLQLAFSPAPCSADESTTIANATVSFIQVCRSHARLSFSLMFSSSSLEWLYNAACACYCYEGCPAIDWYAPVRYSSNVGPPSFVPLVVSVKARRTISRKQRIEALNAMRTAVEEGPQKMGICVLFLIGLDNPESVKSGFLNNEGQSIDPPDKFDATTIWNVQVVVPSDDAFGLSDVVTQTTLDGDAKAEVYTSHGFLHAYSREGNHADPCRDLLRTKPKDVETSFLKELCTSFGQIDMEESKSSK
jgi:hypothetical protein